jgi:integrase
LESRSIQGLTLYYDTQEQEAADIIGEACARSVQIINEMWGLDVPQECRVYVMRSWVEFFLNSPPWHWRILLVLTLPLWAFRVRRLWKVAGGWAQLFGGGRAVGIKPPRLIEVADKRLGERIFHPVPDARDKAQHITCHELVHAFTAHLRLPAWLNEGLAMVTVDRFVGHTTVKEETVDTLTRQSKLARPMEYRRLRVSDEDGWVYHYVRGYWITRYLFETQLELLQGLLEKRQRRAALERELALGLGMRQEDFWTKIDTHVASHFEYGVS